MEKRELLLDSLDAVLSDMHETERSISTRAAGLISATTISLVIAVTLRQRDINVPIWLVAMYCALAMVSAITILGRQLDTPPRGLDWRGLWSDLSNEQVENRLFEAKKLATIVNAERLSFVRVAFAVHIFMVAATIIASLLYLGG